MRDPFADTTDVEAVLLRPLTTQEEPYVISLIEQASALLRQAAPSIDTRIAAHEADSTDPTGVSRIVVSSVVAGAVKRYMVNPTGIASTTQTAGPFSQATSYALRSEKESRGVLQITDADLATLFPNRKRMRAGMMRTRPALAPRPVGRYGPLPTVGEAISAEIMFGEHHPTDSEFIEAEFIVNDGPS